MEKQNNRKQPRTPSGKTERKSARRTASAQATRPGAPQMPEPPGEISILSSTAPARRRGRPRKTAPEPAAEAKVGYDPHPTVIDDPPECDERVGQLPERSFTPTRATEIEATPLPDFPLAHDRVTAPGKRARYNPFGKRGRDLDGEDFDIQTPNPTPEPGKNIRGERPSAVRLPSRAVYHGVATPIRRKPGGAVDSDPARRDPDDPDGRRGERRRTRDGEAGRRYYDDGCLTGWMSDPEYGNAPISNAREQFHCISIIGQIEGHCWLPEGQKATKYEHIIPTLVSVEEDDRIDGLLVLLNTMGGDVEAGLAIAEMIASMSKPTVSLVLGGGHSIGVPLATAADYSLIVPSATMTIHPVRVSGMVVGVPQSFRYMSEMQERITRFICEHSKASAETVREMMMRPDQIATDCGTILEGDEAVRCGIIDEVGGLDRALAVLRELCGNKNR